MKNIKFLIFAITGAMFVSCDTDEFLNPLPDSVIVAETFFKTDADVLINVPSTDTPRIQESHILVGHLICELTENHMF